MQPIRNFLVDSLDDVLETLVTVINGRVRPVVEKFDQRFHNLHVIGCTPVHAFPDRVRFRFSKIRLENPKNSGRPGNPKIGLEKSFSFFKQLFIGLENRKS